VKFIKTALFAAAAVITHPFSTYAQPAPMPVIDAHVHAHFADPAELAKLQGEWREAGVVGAVIHRSDKEAPNPLLAGENVVQCAGIGEKVDAAAVDAALRAGRYGCIKIYLGYVHRYAWDAAYRPLYESAARHDVPVVFHTGDTASARAKLKYADPLTIDEVAVDFSKTRFVIAHCGNPWIESAAEVAYKNPNVWLECSAMLTGDLSAMPADKVETYVTRPIAWVFGYLEDPTKMMFGTDWPLTKVKPYLDAYRKAIPPEHWQAVFHDNAAAVFRFPKKSR
jgi:predicted TIM-barrel fold metal-dependent hydrolase